MGWRGGPRVPSRDTRRGDREHPGLGSQTNHLKMKPTTYRAGVQRLVAGVVSYRESCLTSAGGGPFRPLGGT